MIYFRKDDPRNWQEYPVPADLNSYHIIDVDASLMFDKQLQLDEDGMPILVDNPPSPSHIYDGKAWVIDPKKQADIKAQQQGQIRQAINAKRDACVDGGVYVPEIDKWVDTDEKGRSTLVEIKADFDLNGKDSTYTLICADNTAKTINFSEFKAVWDAVKKLKENMFENAYMHKVLLNNSDDPLSYDWSIGWTKTYTEHLAEVNNE